MRMKNLCYTKQSIYGIIWKLEGKKYLDHFNICCGNKIIHNLMLTVLLSDSFSIVSVISTSSSAACD